MLKNYNCNKTMAALVGSQFTVASDQLKTSVELVEVSAVKEQGKYASFSLIFKGDKAQRLLQSTYTFSHPKIDEAALFIVPIAETPDSFEYQVCFSYEKVS